MSDRGLYVIDEKTGKENRIWLLVPPRPPEPRRVWPYFVAWFIWMFINTEALGDLRAAYDLAHLLDRGFWIAGINALLGLIGFPLVLAAWSQERRRSGTFEAAWREQREARLNEAADRQNGDDILD